MRYILIFIVFFTYVISCFGQTIEVRADYNSIGDCVFIAHNNSKTPLFLNIDFADLENTTFTEPLPYVKLLEPGFNNLFTLERDVDADVPRFNYEIKSFKSNPMADVDLDFPYLLPFAPGERIRAFDVKNIDGFLGNEEPKSWQATGFVAKAGQQVYAARQGIIVEIAGSVKDENKSSWYNSWTNSITLLQPDGTLISYKNVTDKSNRLKLNQKIQAGQVLGELVSNSEEIIIVIFQNSLNTKDFIFIIPEFVTTENKTSIVNSVEEYLVVHPVSVRGLEMTKKEKRNYLHVKK